MANHTAAPASNPVADALASAAEAATQGSDGGGTTFLETAEALIQTLIVTLQGTFMTLVRPWVLSLIHI